MSTRWQCMLRVGRMALEIPFLGLCVRVQIAIFHEVGHDRLPLLAAVLGSLALGFWRPKSALFAFTAAIPPMSGLGILAFLPFPHLLVLGFVSIYLGAAIRRICSSRFSFFQGGGSLGKTSPRELMGLAVDLFIAAILVSLAFQLYGSWGEPTLWPKFWNQSVFGFGDRFYFLNSSFLWLAGLFYFRSISSLGDDVGNWVVPIFAVWISTSTAFFAFQYRFHLPENTNPGYFLPYEDISSFGSISVVLLVYVVASLPA